MRTIEVAEDVYSALEAAADRGGRTIQTLVVEALESWLADLAADEAEFDEIQAARLEAAKGGSVEFEEFFDEILDSRN